MSALDDVKSYMEFWGWKNGGNPGSVKIGEDGRVCGTHGDATWIADVEAACATLQRLQDLATSETRQ
jgi:hypothetical protein